VEILRSAMDKEHLVEAHQLPAWQARKVQVELERSTRRHLLRVLRAARAVLD